MIYLFDSLQKQKIPFESIAKNEVRFYVCGPTVYDDAHLGHARCSIVFDLWRRLFLAHGFDVIFVKNFTDIDDKIIKKMHENNEDLQSLTNRYINSYLRDMGALGVIRADFEPRATQNLDAMIKMITTLLDNGVAYRADGADVYLSVEKDSHYGALSHREFGQNDVSRIENLSDKQKERDFALWKGYKGENDLGFDSPFGKGRPGWHIECSAMIEEILAHKNSEFKIDIHAGGADLLFPHHENEASQTRCCTGVELAKYWLHNGFVNINGEKMSKSLGNSFFVKDALEKYDGEILRNYLMGAHYRLHFDFNEVDLLASKKRLDKLYRLKKRVYESLDSEICESKNSKDLKERISNAKNGADSKFVAQMLASLSDDLNISKALSILEQMINDANLHLDKNPKDKAYKAITLQNLKFTKELLGIGGKNAQEYFQLGVSDCEKAKIENLIQERLEAKKNKDYARADFIRDELKNMGIEIMDTPNGTTWEKA